MPRCPLSRQQLQELDGLLRRVPVGAAGSGGAVLDPFLPPPAPQAAVAAVVPPQQQAASRRTASPEPASAVASGSSASPSQQQQSAAAAGQQQQQQPTSSLLLAPKSPALRPANSYSGVQNVGAAGGTCRWGWKAVDAALYFTWLAYAPLRCPACGAVGHGWQVCIDDDYRCGACHTAVGGGGSRDIVEEIPGDQEQAMSDSDDGGDAGDGAAGGGTGITADLAVTQTARYLLAVLRGVRGIDVPVAAYPGILRAASTIAQLLLLPDCDPEAHSVLRSAALYVACAVLVPAKLPFPALQRVSNCGLQWRDCQVAAAAVGAVIEDFFDDPVNHTRNLMSDLNGRHPPTSKLWDPERTPALQADIASLRKAPRPVRFSPDHTAAIVTVELCRRHPDTAPALLLSWFGKLAAAAPALAESLLKQPMMVWFGDDPQPPKDDDDDAAGDDAATNAAANSAVGSTTTQPRKATSRSSNKMLSVLLGYFAAHFDMHPIDAARMLTSSGLYGGKTLANEALRAGMCCGLYALPLMTRHSAVESPWEPLYRALHSSDRVVVLALLASLARAPAAAHEQPETTKTLQAVLAKHGGTSSVTLNYCLRVADDTESNFNGDYFCSSVTPDGASYVHLTKPLSIRYRAKTQEVYLNTADTEPSKRRSTSSLLSVALLPTRLDLGGPTAKLAIDVVANGFGAPRWAEAVRRLDFRGELRRRMRAATSHLSRAATLMAAELGDSASTGGGGGGGGADGGRSTCDVSTMRTPPTVQLSYAACESLRDVPSTFVHFAASDAAVAATAAALQHVAEALPLRQRASAAAGGAAHLASPKSGPAAATSSRQAAATGTLRSPPVAAADGSSSPPHGGKKSGGAAMAAPPRLQLPPTTAGEGGSRRTSAAASLAGLKALKQLRSNQFTTEDARELRATVRHASDALVRMRRRYNNTRQNNASSTAAASAGGGGDDEDDDGVGDDEERWFFSTLEAGRMTPMAQPRPFAL